MKLIRTEDAVGHVVTVEDIPVLLSMGKEHLYVWEMTPGMVHENDAAERLLALCGPSCGKPPASSPPAAR